MRPHSSLLVDPGDAVWLALNGDPESLTYQGTME